MRPRWMVGPWAQVPSWWGSWNAHKQVKCHRVAWVSSGRGRLKGKKRVRWKKGLKGSIVECPLGRLYTWFVEQRSLTCYHVTPRMYAVLSQNRLEWNVQKGMVSSKGWSIRSGPYECSHMAHLTPPRGSKFWPSLVKHFSSLQGVLLLCDCSILMKLWGVVPGARGWGGDLFVGIPECLSGYLRTGGGTTVMGGICYNG